MGHVLRDLTQPPAMQDPRGPGGRQEALPECSLYREAGGTGYRVRRSRTLPPEAMRPTWPLAAAEDKIVPTILTSTLAGTGDTFFISGRF